MARFLQLKRWEIDLIRYVFELNLFKINIQSNKKHLKLRNLNLCTCHSIAIFDDINLDPRSIWSRGSFEAKLTFDQKTFHTKGIWPQRHLTPKTIDPKNIWTQRHLTQKTFDPKDIWPQRHDPKDNWPQRHLTTISVSQLLAWYISPVHLNLDLESLNLILSL